MRSDGTTLGFFGICWLLWLGYTLGIRAPRSLVPLATSWAFLTVFTIVVGFALRHVRGAVLFSGFGLLFSAIYAWLKI